MRFFFTGEKRTEDEGRSQEDDKHRPGFFEDVQLGEPQKEADEDEDETAHNRPARFFGLLLVFWHGFLPVRYPVSLVQYT